MRGDSQIIEVDPSGAFTAHGIPPELVELYASPAGYRLSKENRSFEPLNASFLKGLVQKDINGLLVLFEPGEQREDRS